MMSDDEKTLDTVEWLIRLALLHTDKVFGAHWDMIRQIPVFELREAVALSVDLDLIFANMGWALAVCMCANNNSLLEDDIMTVGCKALADRLGKKMNLVEQFVQRLTIASGNVPPYGTLPVVEQNEDCRKCKVSLTDFAAWAETQGWQLPEEFPHEIPTGKETPFSDTERERLLKQIAALSLLLAEKSNRYKLGDKPNKNQIAEAIQEIVDAIPDVNGRGTKKSNIRESIRVGLQLLDK